MTRRRLSYDLAGWKLHTLEPPMADPHAHESHGNLFAIYMVVAVVLAVATATSFLFNWMGRPVEEGGLDVISKVIAFVMILAVAIVKATLVGMYFMHLKWDWKLLYFMIIPAFILGTMMMFVFMPDGVFAWHNDIGFEDLGTPHQ
jgi:caa(3)-type oxidase subunit IV